MNFGSALRLSMCAAAVFAMLSAAVGQSSAGSSLKPPTIDQSLEMYNVGSPMISPDGTRVVYEQTRTNWDANAFETDLWIADVGKRERHLLTATGHS